MDQDIDDDDYDEEPANWVSNLDTRYEIGKKKH